MRNPIYDAPIGDRLRDLRRAIDTSLTMIDLGLIRDYGDWKTKESLPEDSFAVGDWIVRPRFKE